MQIQKLKVKELKEQEDFGRGIARIDANTMKELEIKEGDIIDIEGKKTTSVVAIRAYSADMSQKIIRIDKLVRGNCDVENEDFVKITKSNVLEAKDVVLVTLRKDMAIHVAPSLLKQTLYMRPMRKGDVIVTNPVFKPNRKDDVFKQMFGVDIEDVFMPTCNDLKLVVAETIPAGPVKITHDTDVILSQDRPDFTDEDYLGKMTIVNIKDKPNLKNKTEVCSLKDICAISAGKYIVNKYTDKTSTIYFISDYYFKTTKNKKVK